MVAQNKTKSLDFIAMEIAKDHAPNNPNMCFIQPHNSYFETEFGTFDDQQHKKAFEDGSSNSEKSTGIVKNFSTSSSLSSPSSTYSDGLVGNSVISFKAGFGHAAVGSLLSFDQNERFSSQNSFSRMISNQDDYSIWEDNLHYNNYQNSPVLENSTSNDVVALGWLSSEPNANTTINNSIQDLGRQETCLSKRPYSGETTQAPKKQCTAAATKMPESKSKDPQSIAAKNRRERISERLKILQDLVPNGSKVDLVTMLEKAIGYVKFLQLQVKVLATDEFWPAQGGKAPELSQVREAIDAILASQRDRNSSSK